MESPLWVEDGEGARWRVFLGSQVRASTTFADATGGRAYCNLLLSSQFEELVGRPYTAGADYAFVQLGDPSAGAPAVAGTRFSGGRLEVYVDSKPTGLTRLNYAIFSKVIDDD